MEESTRPEPEEVLYEPQLQIPVPYVRLRIWRIPGTRVIVTKLDDDDYTGLETGLVSFTLYQHPSIGPCWVPMPNLPGYSSWAIQIKHLRSPRDIEIHQQNVGKCSICSVAQDLAESSTKCIEGLVRKRLLRMLNCINNSMKGNHILFGSGYDSVHFTKEFIEKVGPIGLTDGTMDLTPMIPVQVIQRGYKMYNYYLRLHQMGLVTDDMLTYIETSEEPIDLYRFLCAKKGVKVAVKNQGEGGTDHLSNPV